LVEIGALERHDERVGPTSQTASHPCDICGRPVWWRFGHADTYECRDCPTGGEKLHWYCSDHVPANLVRLANGDMDEDGDL